MRLTSYRLSAALGLSLMAAASIMACKDITSLAQENPGAPSGSTLYVPGKAREKLSFGVEADQYPAHTITGELIAPFIRAGTVLRKMLPRFSARAKSLTWRRARSA